MRDARTLSFSLADLVGDQPLTPINISLHLFNEFNFQVARFIQGKDNQVDIKTSTIVIREGSYALDVTLSPSAHEIVSRDYILLARQDSLGEMDSRRAAVIDEWQKSAKRFPNRTYQLSNLGSKVERVVINTHTDFHRQEDDLWVAFERYLYGKVMDMGGKVASNIHLQLSGKPDLVISAPKEIIEKQKDNLIYHNAMLRVKGLENLRTGETKEVSLLEFIKYEPKFDDEKMRLLVERGSKAWASVGNITDWIESNRGNKDE